MDKSTLTLFTAIQNTEESELHDIYNQISNLSEYSDANDYDRAKKLVAALEDKAYDFAFLMDESKLLKCKKSEVQILVLELCRMIGDKVKTILENGLIIYEGDDVYVLTSEPNKNIVERALAREHLRYFVTNMVQKDLEWWTEFKFSVLED